MGCETPDIVRTYQRERLVIQASGGPGPVGGPGPEGPPGPIGLEGPPGAQGIPGDNNIKAQGPLSYDPSSGNLQFDPSNIIFDAGFF